MKGLSIVLTSLLLGLLASGPVQPVHAASTFIPAPNRRDMVHDPFRNVLYITSGSQVLRYNVETQQVLSPIELGGLLYGIDLSPDGNTLAVADYTYSNVEGWIYTVNLQTGESKRVSLPFATYNRETGGSFSVAFGNNGDLLISSNNAIGQLYVYNPATGAVTVLQFRSMGTPVLSSSADGSVIAFAEEYQRWGRYRVSDGNIATGEWTGSDNNFAIATSRNGNQITVPVFYGALVKDSDLRQIAILEANPSGQFALGAVYSPKADLLYLSIYQTQEVHIYDTNSLTQVGRFNFGSTFQIPGMPQRYGTGRLRISRDGSLLFAVVEGGVGYKRLTTPPRITITSPQATTYSHTATFNIGWNVAAPDSPIASQSAVLDSTPVSNGQLIDLLFLSLGAHTVKVKVTDAAGYFDNASVTFNITADINSLIAAKERTCALGWINQKTVCNSLDAKLAEAKGAIERGQFSTAKNKLNEFISQLDAQRGKAVNQQAYDLLKTDALYVIAHLP
jgi:WD40 repeat protein